MRKQMEIKNLLFTVMLICSLVLSLSSGVQAQTTLKPQTPLRNFVKQEKSNWSWLASAVNSVTGAGIKVTKSQSDLYKMSTKSSTVSNQAKSIKYTCTVAELASNNKLDYVYSTSAKSFAFLKEQIDQGFCPILVVGKYASGKKVEERMFTMYDYSSDKTNPNIFFYDSATGKAYKVNFEEFVKGKCFSTSATYKYEQTAWVSYVKAY